MIEAKNEQPSYKTSFTNGKNVFIADTSPERGGTGEGFGPHELLEAALATCMNISVRIAAKELSIPLHDVSTSVKLDRSNPEETLFECVLHLPDDLSEADRQRLLNATHSCAVHQTLSKKLTFRVTQGQR